jgi:hypothetical protein
MRFLSPDIWTVGPSHPVLEELVVVGPYPSAEFFRRFFRHFKPARITLVFDGCCDTETVNSVLTIPEIRRSAQIRFGWCSGILHAKVYYVRWSDRTRANSLCKLIWGSLNASQNGFDRNAETLAHVTLAPSVLARYLAAFQHDSGMVEKTELRIANSVTLVLPGFQFTSDRVPPEQVTFESWVQSGVLCYSYQRDSSFMRFRLKLKQALPADFVSRQISDVGLGGSRRNQQVKIIPYLPEDDDTAEVGTPRWRGTYFVETGRGFWTSAECYQSKRELFKAAGADQRAAAIAKLKSPNLHEWYSAISQKLFTVTRRLVDAGRDPAMYFWMGPPRPGPTGPISYIDGARYFDELAKQVERDRQRAENAAFAERFIAGCEFLPVPDFRQSESERFLTNLCQRVVDELNSGKRERKLLIQAIGTSVRNMGVETEGMDAPRLLCLLRDHWREIGPSIRAFHGTCAGNPLQ